MKVCVVQGGLIILQNEKFYYSSLQLTQGLNMGRYNQEKTKTGHSFLKKAIGFFLALQVLIIGFFYYLKSRNSDTHSQPEPQVLALPPREYPELPGDTPGAASRQSVEALIAGDGTQDIEGLQQETAPELPPLNSSDGFFRESLIRISPGLAPWLAGDQSIRNGITLLNDFSQGQRLLKHAGFLKLPDRFIAEADVGGLYLNRQNYQRYDAFAAAVDALNVDATLALYKRFRPLFQQVFAEFGYPEGYNLEGMLTRAAAEIIAAPIIDVPIQLINFGRLYKFADSSIEDLNPVQKQMLRMGPDNTRIVQNKVRDLAQALANVKE